MLASRTAPLHHRAVTLVEKQQQMVDDLALIEDSQELNPSNADAYHNLAEIKRSTGDTVGADASEAMAMKLAPETK